MINPNSPTLSEDFTYEIHLEHINELRDEGYEVYVGQTADEKEPYYALLVPLDEHQKELHVLNGIHQASYLVRRAHCEIPFLFDEKYERMRQFSAEIVMNHPNSRTSSSAWGALIAANAAHDHPDFKLAF